MAGTSSSSSRTDPFDPYAFAVRWYEEHPEVLLDFELEIKRALKAGITLDELEEIEAKAFEFGRLVRVADIKNQGLPRRKVDARSDWETYRDGLPYGTKATAREAYYRGYKHDPSHREQHQG